MPDVLLSNDDVTVLGPPSVVEVLVDIGPTGTRGSQVFVGVGDPNTISIGQTPILNDLYINVSPGTDYGYMYQYVSEPGGNTWIQILEISPTLFSQLHTTTYVDGVAQIVIPISNIVTVTGSPLVSTNFVVQYSIAHTNPTASSVVVPALVGAGTNLVLDFTAIEYAGSAWQNLDEEVTTHIFISIILEDEES